MPPLFPRARGGRVLIAVTNLGRTTFEEVTNFPASEGLVWEIGPVRLRKPDGKMEASHLYQGSRKLAKRIMAALEAVPAGPAPMREAADRCRDLLKDMGTYMDLMRPMKSGQRGQAGSVDFKKAVLKVNEKAAKSDASIVVVTYQEPKEASS